MSFSLGVCGIYFVFQEKGAEKGNFNILGYNNIREFAYICYIVWNERNSRLEICKHIYELFSSLKMFVVMLEYEIIEMRAWGRL